MLIDTLNLKGVAITIKGDQLVVETDDPLTDEQREFIRSHKPQIMAELMTASTRNLTVCRTRIPESVEAEWKKATHPLDPESQGRQKIAWVMSCCEELGTVPDSELFEWYRNDLKDISGMTLEHVYRLIRDYVNMQGY